MAGASRWRRFGNHGRPERLAVVDRPIAMAGGGVKVRVERLCAVAVLAGAVAACASGGRDPGVGSSNQPASPASGPSLSAVATEVDSFLRGRYPGSYAGIQVDEARGAFGVYRLPDSGLDDAVRARWPTAHVTFDDARWTAVQMERLADRVMDERRYWKDRGVTVNGAGPVHDGSAIEVMIDEAITAWQPAFDERYGKNAVRLVVGGAVAIPGQIFRPSARA